MKKAIVIGVVIFMLMGLYPPWARIVPLSQSIVCREPVGYACIVSPKLHFGTWPYVWVEAPPPVQPQRHIQRTRPWDNQLKETLIDDMGLSKEPRIITKKETLIDDMGLSRKKRPWDTQEKETLIDDMGLLDEATPQKPQKPTRRYASYDKVTVDVTRLCLQWAMVVVVTGMVVFLISTKNDR